MKSKELFVTITLQDIKLLKESLNENENVYNPEHKNTLLRKLYNIESCLSKTEKQELYINIPF